MNSENKLVFISERKRDNSWYETGGTKAGNRLYTKLHNAINNLKKCLWNQTQDEGRIIEYKLVPTGKVYNSLGEEID